MEKSGGSVNMRAIHHDQGCDVSLSSTPPRSPLVLALIFSSPLLADDLFLDGEPLPQVLTATRLKQSPAAVPGSMTVIDSQLITASGAQNSARS